MAILIGIGLSGMSAQTGTPAPPALHAVASVAALPTANAVFDSGAARGGDAADIPLTGTTDAPDGAQIEARIVRADTGAQVHPWAAVAMAAGGAWSGAFPAAQRSPHWLKAEVRVQNSAAPAGTMGGQFAVGHVWAWYGQSNVAKFALFDGNKTLVPDTIVEPGNFQVWSADRSGADGPPRVQMIGNDPDNLPMPGIARFANIFSQVNPGIKVAIAVHAQPGEGAMSMIDPDPTRKWEHEVALYNGITAHGTQVGMVLSLSWTAFVTNNTATMVPIMTQKAIDGTPLNIGDPIPGGILYHSMTEFYDLNYTKFGFIGSSGRALSIPGGGANPVDFATTNAVEDTAAQSIAIGWQNVMADKVNFPEMLDFQWSHETAVMRGFASGSDNWQDWVHFSNRNEHGFPYLAEIYANQIMRMLGMIDFDIPDITESNWTPTHIDVWNPDHDITTRRELTGTPSPFVRGFAFNGLLMTTEAQLIANAGGSGRQGVRITPAGGVNGSETFTYGVGVQPGFTSYPQDYFDNYVLDLPVMDVGQVGSVGMPIRPRQLADAFVSNLTGAPSFTGVSPIISPAGLGAPFTQLTIEGEIRRNNNGGGVIASMSGTNLLFEILSDGTARWAGGSAGMIGGTTADVAFPVGVFVPFVWTIDFTAGTGRFWYGDTGDVAVEANVGSPGMSTTRQFSMRGANEVADVRFVQMWKAYTPTRDTSGLGTPLKRIEADSNGNAVQIPILPAW